MSNTTEADVTKNPIIIVRPMSNSTNVFTYCLHFIVEIFPSLELIVDFVKENCEKCYASKTVF